LSTFSWDWWCTLTFHYESSANAADRSFRRWIRDVEKARGCRRALALRYFVAHEVGRLGRLHLHALIGGVDPYVQRTTAWEKWKERNGFAYILPYDPAKGASHYIAKYVTKEFARYDIEDRARASRSLNPLGDATEHLKGSSDACIDPVRTLSDTRRRACTKPRIVADNAERTRKGTSGHVRSTRNTPRIASKRPALVPSSSPTRACAASAGDSGSHSNERRT